MVPFFVTKYPDVIRVAAHTVGLSSFPVSRRTVARASGRLRRLAAAGRRRAAVSLRWRRHGGAAPGGAASWVHCGAACWRAAGCVETRLSSTPLIEITWGAASPTAPAIRFTTERWTTQSAWLNSWNWRAPCRGAARSQLFIATTLKESGLLGAEFYAAHPRFPLQKTVCGIDMDAVNVPPAQLQLAARTPR